MPPEFWPIKFVLIILYETFSVKPAARIENNLAEMVLIL